MNSLDRIQSVISGKMPDRMPVCLHNFLHACHEDRIPILLEAIHLLKAKLSGRFAIRANCDQRPFPLATGCVINANRLSENRP